MDAGKAVAPSPLVAGVGSGRPRQRASSTSPRPATGPAPISQTVWTGGGDGGPPAPSNGRAGRRRRRRRRAGRAAAVLTEDREPPTALESLQAIDWTLPPLELLEARRAGRPDAAIDHARTRAGSRRSCCSFAIPAKVVAVNSGPVVTQYEVKPEHHVKVSRIEALADDLAMALAARSIRIEAPIPGKDVVGIEIPNAVSEVVGFRPLVEETNMLGGDEPADLRPRPRRVGQADRGRPRQDAAPPRRRRDRLGQERLRQRPDHEPPDARPARRGPADPGRPQAGRARARTTACRTSSST